MSAVRMCDKCGKVFSELSSGWQTFSATTVITDEYGVQQSIPQRMDACEDCSMLTPKMRARVDADKEVRSIEAQAGIVRTPSGEAASSV